MTTTPTKNESLPEFGDYVEIEQKRFGVPNEMYCYKVIGTLESNCWTDVPVQSGKRNALHDRSEPVVAAICCGVMEEKVERFRLSDVTITKRRFPALTREAPTDGVDVEAMLVACVPGGSSVDPQTVADNIREWFATPPAPQRQSSNPSGLSSESAPLSSERRLAQGEDKNPSMKCIWPDCGHDTNQVSYSPGCTGVGCPARTEK